LITTKTIAFSKGSTHQTHLFVASIVARLPSLQPLSPCEHDKGNVALSVDIDLTLSQSLALSLSLSFDQTVIVLN
jgi:hypothetical protein